MDDSELWVHDTITGDPIALVESAASEWSTSIVGDGASTETIVVNDADQPWGPGEVEAMFKPNERMLARWVDGQPMYAHKIEGWDYDKSAGKVNVSAVDLLGESEWRMVGPVSYSSESLTVTNRTPSGAIAAALARMMQWAPDWQYPIDLPADAPGDISGFWPFWKKIRIADIINEIRARAGVEVFLRPYATAGGGIRFQTRVGAPITIGSSLFNLDADESPLAGVRYRVDGKRQVTGLLGVGNGFGEDQETKWRGGVINIPIRDTKQSFPDLTGDALDQATDTFYHENTSPLVQWSIGSYTVGDGYTADLAAPGRVWQLESNDDPVIPDGIHTLRVIKASGGTSREIRTEVQYA